MSTPTASLIAQFDFHTRIYNNVTEGITNTESNTQTNEHVNHIKWVAGHLLHSRINSLSKIAGLQPDSSYGPLFDRGTIRQNDTVYPTMEEITSRWRNTAAAIREGLAKLPEDALTAKSNAQVPIADDTMRGLLSFLISHEAFHIGQLSILRKMAGKDAMSFK